MLSARSASRLTLVAIPDGSTDCSPIRSVASLTGRSTGVVGVVVMDCSGSMSLSVEEIKEILTHAPGATVLGYSDKGDEGTNAWILAHKGKMVAEIPKMGSGNGVDHPAIIWGVKAKQRPTSPVIWISDGGVCGKNAGFSDILARPVREHLPQAQRDRRRTCQGGD